MYQSIFKHRYTSEQNKPMYQPFNVLIHISNNISHNVLLTGVFADDRIIYATNFRRVSTSGGCIKGSAQCCCGNNDDNEPYVNSV